MRLTPLDIRRQEFPQRFRGYDPEEVDTFLDLIADDVEALINEKTQTAERIVALEAQLAEFKEIEKSLRDAFVMAEKMSTEASDSAQRRAEAMVQEAELKARNIVGEAEGKGRQILSDAETRRRSLILELEALESQRNYTLAKFRTLIEDQKAILEAHSTSRGNAPSRIMPFEKPSSNLASVPEPVHSVSGDD